MSRHRSVLRQRYLQAHSVIYRERSVAQWLCGVKVSALEPCATTSDATSQGTQDIMTYTECEAQA